jgi:hypothetical protein
MGLTGMGFSSVAIAAGAIMYWAVTYPGCPWPDLSPRFWPPEVLTPQSGCSVLAQRRSASFLTRFLHSE